MNKNELEKMIDVCHSRGQLVAVSFCHHVPQEVLDAAGMASLQLIYVDGDFEDAARMLPRNLCPLVKQCCNLCEDPVLEKVDLILGESSCDGKKKMYELISRQDKLYYYQVPQGEDRDYVNALIRSEIRFLMREVKRRFDLDVTEAALRKSGERLNEERRSIEELSQIQMSKPPAAWGMDIYTAILESRLLTDPAERAAAIRLSRERLLEKESPVPKRAKRILLTGCPASGAYKKVIRAVEENGGVIVCFENCEVLMSAVRRFDTAAEDVVGALADCYQNTACAIMSPNHLRRELLQRYSAEYQADGILDLHLQTCHPYTVEKDKISRFCEDELGIPYMAIETDFSDSDVGQLNTRVAAFIEML